MNRTAKQTAALKTTTQLAPRIYRDCPCGERAHDMKTDGATANGIVWFYACWNCGDRIFWTPKGRVGGGCHV